MTTDFFKPEDFVFSVHPEIPSNKWDQMTAANIANTKIAGLIDRVKRLTEFVENVAPSWLPSDVRTMRLKVLRDEE